MTGRAIRGLHDTSSSTLSFDDFLLLVMPTSSATVVTLLSDPVAFPPTDTLPPYSQSYSVSFPNLMGKGSHRSVLDMMYRAVYFSLGEAAMVEGIMDLAKAHCCKWPHRQNVQQAERRGPLQMPGRAKWAGPCHSHQMDLVYLANSPPIQTTRRVKEKIHCPLPN
jgi:hypothetical protein